MPHILGHECAGTIVALGSNVVPPEWGYKVGDRVAVRSFHLSPTYIQHIENKDSV